jgi:hypothetical protein
MPRKTNIARLRRTMSGSARHPILAWSFDLGTVVILSTASRQTARMPFSASGSTTSGNSGASAGLVVKEQIVMDGVLSNRSS